MWLIPLCDKSTHKCDLWQDGACKLKNGGRGNISDEVSFHSNILSVVVKNEIMSFLLCSPSKFIACSDLMLIHLSWVFCSKELVVAGADPKDKDFFSVFPGGFDCFFGYIQINGGIFKLVLF
jgi:hypothetical protein